jgi:hypothetical protein
LLLVSQFGNKEKNRSLAQSLLSQYQSGAIAIETVKNFVKDIDILDESRVVQTCLEMFSNGSFIGGNLQSFYNTAWGLLNTVTEYYNHHLVSKNANTQINSLWLGNKAQSQLNFLQSISGFATEASNRQKSTQTVSVRAW